MKAVFLRELRAYFSTVIGWLFLCIFFCVYDLYFTAYNLGYGYSYLSYSLGSVTFVFIIIIPILAMRSMAEERKLKTDQLLYTSPVSIPRVLFGKYLSMVTIFSICMGAVCLYPLIMARFGSIPFSQCYDSILGMWLFGCLAIALCMFLSSITESQVIAAVISFAILFICYMMSSIIGLIGDGNLAAQFFSKLLQWINIVGPLDNFNNGILDITGLIYYISGSLLFIFLTCQLVQKHRWSVSSRKIQRGVFNAVFLIIGIAIVVAVNAFATALPQGIKNIDITNSKLYTLTDESKKMLESLKEDVELYVLADKDSADETVRKTVENYALYSPHVTVEYIDPAISPTFYTTYTDTAPTDGSVIAVCGDTSTVVDYADLFEYDVDYTNYSYTVTGFDGEGQISSAISYVSSGETYVVYTITGHGETELEDSFNEDMDKLNIDVIEETLLEQDSISTDDADGIIINAPTSDFSEDDAQKVIDYLAEGGKALITTSYQVDEGDLPNFDSILEAYGIDVSYGLVMEADTSRYYNYPMYLLPFVDDTEYSDSVEGYIFMPYAQALVNLESDTENLTWTDILYTTELAYLKTDITNQTSYSKTDGDAEGQFILAANVTDSSSGASLTAVGSVYIFTEDADGMVSGQNQNLFKDIVGGFISGDESVTSIGVKSYTADPLTVTGSVIWISQILLVIILPVVLIVIGIAIWVRRRRT